MALVALGPTEIALASREMSNRAPQLIVETRRVEGSAAG
jgi:hypothetical protein